MSKELTTPVPDGLSFMDNTSFNQMIAVAKFLAGSDLIPSHFANKPANVFIALEIALRQEMSPFMVMQSLYVVHGRPAFEGKYLMALANRAGWNLQFDTKKDASGKIVSCQAIGEKNGVKVYGPTVTAEMVKGEGWDKPKKAKTKTGHEYELPSKWVTMPSLMYIYRAGAYFVNTVCPELKMGMQSLEEVEDITETAVITTAPEPSPIQEAIPVSELQPDPSAPTFDALWADYSRSKPDDIDKHIQNFLTAAASHSKTTVDDIKEKAATQWPEFVNSFEKWVKKQEKKAASAPPVSEPAPVNGKAQDPQGNAVTGNGQAQNGQKIVKAITDDQIDQIESLCAAKGIPVADALIGEGHKCPLIELDFDSAAALIGKLAAL